MSSSQHPGAKLEQLRTDAIASLYRTLAEIVPASVAVPAVVSALVADTVGNSSSREPHNRQVSGTRSRTAPRRI